MLPTKNYERAFKFVKVIIWNVVSFFTPPGYSKNVIFNCNIMSKFLVISGLGRDLGCLSPLAAIIVRLRGTVMVSDFVILPKFHKYAGIYFLFTPVCSISLDQPLVDTNPDPRQFNRPREHIAA